jgi:hypothetical protein
LLNPRAPPDSGAQLLVSRAEARAGPAPRVDLRAAPQTMAAPASFG